MSREEWLRHGVEKIDRDMFGGELNLQEKQFQIACGWTSSKKALGETLFPYEGEDVQLDDFFPITIHINCTIKDPVEMLEVLVHECIHAFYGIHGHKKDFGAIAKRVGFEKPYRENHPGEDLKDKCLNVYQELINEYGEFPGKPIVIHKERKEGKKNSIVLFCPSCGYEVRVTKKMFEKYENQFPTCVCGTKMGQVLDESSAED